MAVLSLSLFLFTFFYLFLLAKIIGKGNCFFLFVQYFLIFFLVFSIFLLIIVLFLVFLHQKCSLFVCFYVFLYFCTRKTSRDYAEDLCIDYRSQFRHRV